MSVPVHDEPLYMTCPVHGKQALNFVFSGMKINGNMATCPICQRMGPIPDGIWRVPMPRRSIGSILFDKIRKALNR